MRRRKARKLRRSPVAQSIAVEHDGARLRRHTAVDRTKQSRLAGATGADQGHAFAAASVNDTSRHAGAAEPGGTTRSLSTRKASLHCHDPAQNRLSCFAVARIVVVLRVVGADELLAAQDGENLVVLAGLQIGEGLDDRLLRRPSRSVRAAQT